MSSPKLIVAADQLDRARGIATTRFGLATGTVSPRTKVSTGRGARFNEFAKA
jgi:hypothetical protein